MRKEMIFGIALAFASTSAFAAFSDQDANGNGQLSKDEFYGTMADQGKYSDWDLNGDGLIDEDEFNELGYDWDYDTWDANDDGYLDSGEFYDGLYTTYDEDENGHWDDGEWDDAGDAGILDV